MPAPTSSQATAGTNATADEYNDLRTDAIERYVRFQFEVKGTLVVGNEQGPRFIVPDEMTVQEIKHKIASGTSATIRIQKDTSDVDASISVTTSMGSETSISSPSLTEDEVLTLDITAVSGSPTDLLVQVLCKETLA